MAERMFRIWLIDDPDDPPAVADVPDSQWPPPAVSWQNRIYVHEGLNDDGIVVYRSVRVLPVEASPPAPAPPAAAARETPR
jgi:hypothetical protein